MYDIAPIASIDRRAKLLIQECNALYNVKKPLKRMKHGKYSIGLIHTEKQRKFRMQ